VECVRYTQWYHLLDGQVKLHFYRVRSVKVLKTSVYGTQQLAMYSTSMLLGLTKFETSAADVNYEVSCRRTYQRFKWTHCRCWIYNHISYSFTGTCMNHSPFHRNQALSLSSVDGTVQTQSKPLKNQAHSTNTSPILHDRTVPYYFLSIIAFLVLLQRKRK
jgi:hypothetical protein